MKDITATIYYSSPTIQLQEIGGPETAFLTSNSPRDQYLLVQQPCVSESFMQMEGTSNGKLEESREVQSQDEYKDVHIQDVGDSKPVDEFARDIDIADNSEPANKREIKVEDFSEPADKSIDGKDDSGSSTSSSDEETDPAEKSPHKVVEEKEVLDSVDQPPADLEYSKERNEKLLPSTDETGESSPSATDFSSKEINDKTLPPFDESNGFPPAVTDLASKASIENDNESSPVVADVLPKGYEGTEPEAGEENTGESSYKARSETGGGECDRHEIGESTANESSVSVSGHPLQPTSWRSCCGLLEVLRRSGR